MTAATSQNTKGLIFLSTLLLCLSLIIAIPVNDVDLFTVSSADLETNAMTAKLMKTEKRLIKTSPNLPAKWMNNAEIAQLRKNHQYFMDKTYTGDAVVRVTEVKKQSGISSKVTQQATAAKLIDGANDKLMKEALKSLTGFKNRYYRSSYGTKSSEWLFQQVKKIVTANKGTLNVNVSQFSHAWPQKSIIVKIKGSEIPDEVVILGGHQDSINQSDELEGVAPGADDDGSGAVSVLEALRATLAAKFVPKRTLEFHWYAAEEGGLLGSQDIAREYQEKGTKVVAMLQLDMTGFPKKEDSDIGIVTDYTDQALSELITNMVPNYTDLQANPFECGYGCSDHASWNEYGFPSAFAFESSNMRENENIHSDQDTYKTVDFGHALRFVKLALGFIAEVTNKPEL